MGVILSAKEKKRKIMQVKTGRKVLTIPQLQT
jgi:hypothetical protein